MVIMGKHNNNNKGTNAALRYALHNISPKAFTSTSLQTYIQNLHSIQVSPFFTIEKTPSVWTVLISEVLLYIHKQSSKASWLLDVQRNVTTESETSLKG